MDELGVFRMLLVANGDIKVVRSTVALMFISQIDEMVYRSCRYLFLSPSAPPVYTSRFRIAYPKLYAQCNGSAIFCALSVVLIQEV